MSEPRDEHLQALQGIWAEMKTINARVNTTNTRLESLERTTNERFESLERRLDARFEGVEVRLDAIHGRLETHGAGITKLVEEVTKMNGRFDNFLVGAHGKEHDELRARVDRLEKDTGLR